MQTSQKLLPHRSHGPSLLFVFTVVMVLFLKLHGDFSSSKTRLACREIPEHSAVVPLRSQLLTPVMALSLSVPLSLSHPLPLPLYPSNVVRHP